MANKIESIIARFLRSNTSAPAVPLGGGLFLKYTVKNGEPKLQMWRVGGQKTSEQEAIVVLNALKNALRTAHPATPYLVRRSKFDTHTTPRETYHGCSLTWAEDTSAQPGLTMPTWYAISVKQPWPEAIMYHGKDIENRGYPPPADLIGQRIALHASKIDDPYGRAAIEHMLDITLRDDAQWPRGAIVATAVLAGVVRQSESPWFINGQYGWQLTDVRVLRTPLICRGQKRYWPVPAQLASHLTHLTNLSETEQTTA